MDCIVPSQLSIDEKASTPMRKIQTHALDDTFVIDIGQVKHSFGVKC